MQEEAAKNLKSWAYAYTACLNKDFRLCVWDHSFVVYLTTLFQVNEERPPAMEGSWEFIE
jgi:hypothetical protein